MTRSTSARSSAPSVLRSSAGIAEGWPRSLSGSAQIGRSPRPSWRAARPARPAGTACALPPPRFFSTSSSDKTWMVLPRPMSSARQAPSLSRRADEAIARRPADRAAACLAAIGRDRRARAPPAGATRPASAPARDRPRSGSSRRRPARPRHPRKCRLRPACAWLRRTTGRRRRRGARSPRIDRASGSIVRGRSRPTCRG